MWISIGLMTNVLNAEMDIELKQSLKITKQEGFAWDSKPMSEWGTVKSTN